MFNTFKNIYVLQNTTSTHCKSQNTEQFYDSNSYTSSDSFEETLPSTIYSDDSNSANDIWVNINL